ncbi:mitogen-activated protein kinase kinase kinase 18-like [Quercus lobata]|uniref:mitogen-activated protein kinase kinase kinase 18-like n=1 Tax=Quercus lobata TaxID=97700 RepID=UPI0012486CC1|nr:mitogen-activated protein kinase kinase kinase 18-like [Quercus lobata]
MASGTHPPSSAATIRGTTFHQRHSSFAPPLSSPLIISSTIVSTTTSWLVVISVRVYGWAGGDFRVDLSECILKGLNHIHRCGYVHCDIKPENVLLVNVSASTTVAAHFVAKIADLGLAKRGKEFNKRDLFNLIADKCELPEIPGGISSQAKDFLKACLVKKYMYRFTAEMLMDHPFLDRLGDEELPAVTCVSEIDEADYEVFCFSEDYEFRCSSGDLSLLLDDDINLGLLVITIKT